MRYLPKELQLFTLLLVFTLMSLHTTIATTENIQCVTAEIQGISPSAVSIDQEFTLGVNLEGCGTKIPKEITFALISLPPDIIVTEDWITKIPQLSYGTSERYIRYHMRTTPDANPGPHIINMRLAYGNQGSSIVKNYNVTINVIGEDAEPRISSVSTNPEYIYEGDTVDLTLEIENYGEAIAKSVVVSLEHPFEGIKDATVGTLSLNGTKNALFKFKAKQAGDFNIPVSMTYEDDFGNQKDTHGLKLTVLKKKGTLNVASVKVDPVLPYIDDTVELTMRIENFGDRKLSSIRIYIDHPFIGLKESFIGTLDPHEDGPTVTTFVADQAGEYEIPVRITYTDDFGEEYVNTKVNIIILKKKNRMITAALALLILGVFGGLGYYTIKTKKSKDKIIKQLMKGNNTARKK